MTGGGHERRKLGTGSWALIGASIIGWPFLIVFAIGVAFLVWVARLVLLAVAVVVAVGMVLVRHGRRLA